MKVLRYMSVVAICIAGGCSDNSADDDAGTDDESGMASACVDLLGCAEKVDNQTLGAWEEMYGEGSPCWEGDESVALECAQGCVDAMQMLLMDVGWDYPWDCDADAPFNTNDIDTIDGVTWEWQVVGGNCVEEDTPYVDALLYTTFNGKNSWKFDGEKWIEHPDVDDPTVSAIECQIDTESYLDFECGLTDYVNAFLEEGVFSLDFSSATAEWIVSYQSIVYVCEVEGTPIMN